MAQPAHDLLETLIQTGGVFGGQGSRDAGDTVAQGPDVHVTAVAVVVAVGLSVVRVVGDADLVQDPAQPRQTDPAQHRRAIPDRVRGQAPVCLGGLGNAELAGRGCDLTDPPRIDCASVQTSVQQRQPVGQIARVGDQLPTGLRAQTECGADLGGHEFWHRRGAGTAELDPLARVPVINLPALFAVIVSVGVDADRHIADDRIELLGLRDVSAGAGGRSKVEPIAGLVVVAEWNRPHNPDHASRV